MGLFEDVEAIKAVERLGETEIAEGERRVKLGRNLLSVYASLREQVDKDPTTLASTAETARGIADGNEEGPTPSAESAAAPRKPRSDIGKSRGPRATKAQSNEDRMREGDLPEMAVRLPVDQAKNSAEIAALRRALANGPLTPEELLSVSGLDADAIGAHGRAGAIVEIVDGTREAHGRFKAIEEPRLLFRLVSVGAKS